MATSPAPHAPPRAGEGTSTLLLLARRAPVRISLVLLMGVFSGLTNSSLLALINSSISAGFDGERALAVGALALLVVVTNTLPDALMIPVVARVARELRLHIARAIVSTPLRRLEVLGRGPVLTAFGEDLHDVLGLAASLPGLVNSVTLLVGCFAYLVWLSPQAGALVVPVMLAGSAMQTLAHRLVRPMFVAARDARDELEREQHHLVDGVKQLKMSASRRAHYVDVVLADVSERVRRTSVRGDVVSSLISNAGHAHTWLTAVLAAFIVPLYADEEATRAGVFIVLYASGVMSFVAGFSGRFVRAGVAMERLRRIELYLQDTVEPAALPASGAATRAVEELSLHEVTFEYSRDDDRRTPFRLGPMTLCIRRPELVFVVGGNGSGKTTLAKLITGLYAPDSGEVRCNGTTVTDDARDAYRSSFSAVFSDVHVFESLLCDVPELDSAAQRLISRLALDEVVEVRNGRFSTVHVSSGQHKRLALVMALLEDRPVYLFDEWTADQDPEFRSVFYREIVPDLVRRGKIVIAITHDDRYFHLGDRILRLHDGQLVEQLRAEASGSR